MSCYKHNFSLKLKLFCTHLDLKNSTKLYIDHITEHLEILCRKLILGIYRATKFDAIGEKFHVNFSQQLQQLALVV